MMIANWMHDSVSSQVIGSAFFPGSPSPESKSRLPENPARYAKKRDREVPYGMKGGEF